MTDATRLQPDDLTDAQIEQVLNSRLFQKGSAYGKLADGIEVLEQEDEIYSSLINSITKQYENNLSEGSVRECLRLFRGEVKTFTEPLIDEGEGADADDFDELYAGATS